MKKTYFILFLFLSGIFNPNIYNVFRPVEIKLPKTT